MERTQQDKVQEITDKLEAGIKDLFESEKYMNYLNTMAKFYNYSFNNSLLIALQKPDATYVAGYTSWEKNFGRQVQKGEKGIRILAPSPYKITKDVEMVDPVTQKPVIGKNGEPLRERVQTTIPAYKVTTVFDISQTQGKDLPEITTELKGDVHEYEKFFEVLKRVSPVPIEIQNIRNGANGYYHLEEKQIVIREGMSEMQNIKTAIHEISHAMLHDKETGIKKDNLPDTRTKEVEAESVAYTVCQHYGIETSDYSFGYVAGWSSGRELEELRKSMNTIRGTAADIIKQIDGKLDDMKLVENDTKTIGLASEKEAIKKVHQVIGNAVQIHDATEKIKDVVKHHHRSH